MNEEHWEPLRGFPLYIISNLGRVKNTKTNRFLKCRRVSGQPYLMVGVYNPDGKQKNLHIHRQVGLHFLPHTGGEFQVCHKDETLPEPERHQLSNLFIGNNRDNMIDMWRKNRNPRQVVTRDVVRQLRETHQRERVTHRELSERFSLTMGVVTDILLGRTWKHVE